MSAGYVAAIDLGASSGRVTVGRVGPRTLELNEVHRFPNEPVALPDGLHWDVLRLYRDVLDGLRRAARIAPSLASIGVDAWGVDYGLIDADRRLLGNPYHYRDPRGARGVERVHATVSGEQLYAVNGVQFMPINTIYQLAASIGSAELDAADAMLLIPDLMAFWLTGVVRAEATVASTSGLIDATSGEWAANLATGIGIPAAILPQLVAPGEALGPLSESARSQTGLSAELPLIAVGSHDTASAVVGVPAADDRCAYISCGTWSLVGIELEQPILSEASRAANFTNERGVDGSIRYLRNVMGLWLLQESMQTWQQEGHGADLTKLVAAARELPVGGAVIDVDDPVLVPPGDVPTRIAALCRDSQQAAPDSQAAVVRCILDSLAGAYARVIDDLRRVSNRDIRTIHLVGGGSQNGFLCQLTADACELPVIAGPVEATALGNVLVQARAGGLLSGDLATLRALIRATQPLRRFEPTKRPLTSVA